MSLKKLLKRPIQSWEEGGEKEGEPANQDPKRDSHCAQARERCLPYSLSRVARKFEKGEGREKRKKGRGDVRKWGGGREKQTTFFLFSEPRSPSPSPAKTTPLLSPPDIQKSDAKGDERRDRITAIVETSEKDTKENVFFFAFSLFSPRLTRPTMRGRRGVGGRKSP